MRDVPCRLASHHACNDPRFAETAPLDMVPEVQAGCTCHVKRGGELYSPGGRTILRLRATLGSAFRVAELAYFITNNWILELEVEWQ